jgi:hypothetical protein
MYDEEMVHEAREAWRKRLADDILDDELLPDAEIGAAFFHDWEY